VRKNNKNFRYVAEKNRKKIVAIMNLKFINFNHFETPIIIEEKLTFCSLLNFQIKALETKQFSGTDPPPLIYGRRMLIKNQVFRI
jgi:hypothetical protein